MRLADFDYQLPPGQIAIRPAEPRDSARMLVLERAGGEFHDRTVRELPDLLKPGDLLVVNDTRVIPARIFGRRATGGKVELLLLRREPGGIHQALVKAHRRLRPDEVVELDGGLAVTLIERPEGGAIWRIRIEPSDRLEAVLERHGHVPLPPYIKRADTPADRERYQTVFAAQAGSAAAPTAGLHFTPELLDRLDEQGVGTARVTLHVGYGTFQPIEAEQIEDHRMHSEEFEVSEEAARLITERKGRLVAVGTTSARVIETLARTGGVRAVRGNTDLYLYPGEPLRLVDAMLTNFHLPRSSLLLLVSAFAGRERILDAYRHALEKGYRFYSYGDAMLIL